MTTELRVDLNQNIDNSYSIHIGEDLFSRQSRTETDIFIIDRNVFHLHSKIMPKDNYFLYDADEKNKTFEKVIDILDFFKEKRCIRSTVITAIGGGITGDITAFAASIYMRGIKCRQVPTTLLSMVDSSVGGKCGINFSGTKNFVGTFWQPESVIIDLNFIRTLDDMDFYSGFAEVIKTALTFDKSFVEYLVTQKTKIHNRDTEVLTYIINKCCEIKADVVMKDERESGLRRLLNFGHTFAHAIETDSQHAIKHGHAVATGMYLESLYAQKAGVIDKHVLEEIEEIIKLFGYETTYPIESKKIFINALTEDKKALSSGLVLSLTDNIGSGKIIEGVQIEHLSSFFNNLDEGYYG